jgi:hypothetical protein
VNGGFECVCFPAVGDPRFSFGKSTASSDKPERARPDRAKQFAGESIAGDVL